MARPTTILAVFFISFNVFAGFLLVTGVDTTLGLDANVGGDKEIQETKQNAQEIETGTGTGLTLFGMYNTLATGVSDVFGAIFPGLRMIQRAGTPRYIINGLGTVFTVIMAIDVILFLRRGDL